MTRWPGRFACVAAGAALAIGIGCQGTRRVGGSSDTVPASEGAATPAAPSPGTDAGGSIDPDRGLASAPGPAAVPDPDRDSGPDPDGDPDPDPVSGSSPTSGSGTAPAASSSSGSVPATRAPPEPEIDLEAALRPALIDPTRAGQRRRQFGRAVSRIAAQLGVPISAERAMRDLPCGGWSRPDCPNLARGLAIARASAPVIASFHRKRTRDIAPLLVDAVSVHAIWHDAYGYVLRHKKKGPGYTYAGCLFSKCDATVPENGQVDGILYQVGRLLGTVTGPACGPSCTLADP